MRIVVDTDSRQRFDLITQVFTWVVVRMLGIANATANLVQNIPTEYKTS